MARIDAKLVERLDGALGMDLEPTDGRLGKVKRYLKGDHDLPYMPTKAKPEYRGLAKKAVTNWTPLLPDTFVKSTFVDGYRSPRSSTDEEVWQAWQANGLDARQTIAHRGALEYGTSYSLILPGSIGSKRVPYWRPLSPLRSLAWYTDDDDDFPEIGLLRKGTTVDGARLVEIFDRVNRYTFALPADTSEGWKLSRTDEHGLGVTPFVRFRDRLDGEAVGIVRPMLDLQDRVNEIVFSTLIALQFASFRQKWATGLAIPEDDDGNPVEPFQAAVDRLWVSEDSEARFGDFAQTDIAGHLRFYDATVKTYAAIAQISPNLLTGDLVNLAADALAQLEASTNRKREEYETIWGEAHELEASLAAKAGGYPTPAATAQVRWRDTEARSLAQTVDALGKMVQMLEVPAEGAWEKIPGITDGDITRWKELRAQSDPVAELIGSIGRQATPVEESE